MKWIKASERLPEHDGVYYIKWISSRNSGTMTKLAIEHYKSNLEWLDESLSTEVKGQQGDQEFLQMQFPGKEGSDIHKPTDEQEMEEIRNTLKLSSQPQEVGQEKAICSHCGDTIEHPLCRKCEIALTLPDEEY